VNNIRFFWPDVVQNGAWPRRHYLSRGCMLKQNYLKEFQT